MPSISDSSVRPDRQLNAATVVLWRGRRTVQLELGPNRVLVDEIGSEQLSALLPQRDRIGPVSRASPPDPALVSALGSAGFLTDRSPVDPLDRPGDALPAQFGPELSALVGRHGDAGAALLSRRRSSAVAVHGTSRITTSIASTLGSAGIGWVQLVHGQEVSAGDSCPGGLSPDDEGARFGVAGVQAIRRYAPDVATAPIPRGRFADLVILTDPAPVEPAVRNSLHLDGLAHLPVAVDGSTAVIGPLVTPGTSSCLHCTDLHRSDRDPAWPILALQLSSRPRHRIAADVALCVAATGVAVGQALAYLDGRRPETVNATLEWHLPDWRLRRRSWPPHHDCDCGAATRSGKHGRMDP